MCMCTETVDLWMWHKQMPAKVNGLWENSMHVTKNSSDRHWMCLEFYIGNCISTVLWFLSYVPGGFY